VKFFLYSRAELQAQALAALMNFQAEFNISALEQVVKWMYGPGNVSCLQLKLYLFNIVFNNMYLSMISCNRQSYSSALQPHHVQLGVSCLDDFAARPSWPEEQNNNTYPSSPPPLYSDAGHFE